MNIRCFNLFIVCLGPISYCLIFLCFPGAHGVNENEELFDHLLAIYGAEAGMNIHEILTLGELDSTKKYLIPIYNEVKVIQEHINQLNLDASGSYDRSWFIAEPCCWPVIRVDKRLVCSDQYKYLKSDEDVKSKMIKVNALIQKSDELSDYNIKDYNQYMKAAIWLFQSMLTEKRKKLLTGAKEAILNAYDLMPLEEQCGDNSYIDTGAIECNCSKPVSTNTQVKNPNPGQVYRKPLTNKHELADNKTTSTKIEGAFNFMETDDPIPEKQSLLTQDTTAISSCENTDNKVIIARDHVHEPVINHKPNGQSISAEPNLKNRGCRILEKYGIYSIPEAESETESRTSPFHTENLQNQLVVDLPDDQPGSSKAGLPKPILKEQSSNNIEYVQIHKNSDSKTLVKNKPKVPERTWKSRLEFSEPELMHIQTRF